MPGLRGKHGQPVGRGAVPEEHWVSYVLTNLASAISRLRNATAGQILRGTSVDTNPKFSNFGGLGCAKLPSPMFLAPGLLKVKPE